MEWTEKTYLFVITVLLIWIALRVWGNSNSQGFQVLAGQLDRVNQQLRQLHDVLERIQSEVEEIKWDRMPHVNHADDEDFEDEELLDP